MLTDTDDLTTQARELVTKALAEKRIVLTRDEPWKISARRLLAGQDIRLGQLTEIFRALGGQPRLVTGWGAVIFKNGDRLMLPDIKQALDVSTLMSKGELEMPDGQVLRLTEKQRDDFKASIAN